MRHLLGKGSSVLRRWIIWLNKMNHPDENPSDWQTPWLQHIKILRAHIDITASSAGAQQSNTPEHIKIALRFLEICFKFPMFSCIVLKLWSCVWKYKKPQSEKWAERAGDSVTGFEVQLQHLEIPPTCILRCLHVCKSNAIKPWSQIDPGCYYYSGDPENLKPSDNDPPNHFWAWEALQWFLWP